jgi:hypothetical protein
MTDSLINLASFSSEKILVARAYKASCILELFANTFSPSHIVGGPNYSKLSILITYFFILIFYLLTLYTF